MSALKRYGPYLGLITAAFTLSLVSAAVPHVSALFHEGPEGFYLSLALLLLVGYGLNYVAPKTSIPSFVWAIFFGMALQVPLLSLTGDKSALLVVVELLAAFVLFAGGVEVPVKNFKKYFGPIAALSVAGTILTVFLFSYVLAGLVGAFGIALPIVSLLVLAAILASTDPTAIIPTLEHLHLRRPFIRDIAIAESAVNDVVGTIVTRFFLVAALGAATFASVGEGFAPLLSKGVVDSFALMLVWGLLVGILGAWILKTWGNSVRTNHWSDPALFFAVPIFTFALGSLVGGSGFLAAFVAGLLFESNAGTRDVRAFFDQFVGNFIKPIIFILLGALVPLGILADTMPLGIVVALVFMFLIRPAVVFATLLPWMQSKVALISWREALFLSFIRETGAIPAVLILTAVAAGIAGADIVFALGMWVILLTLTLEPPLTPLVARRLGLTHFW